jgi:8-oxo-dGTP pyrophosphatase MutT (NUDIX family)/deoxyadenosine/deoxycytidine kinase
MLYDEEQPARPAMFHAVGCICFCTGRVLFLQRTDEKSHPRHWGFPSGKIRDGESPIAAAIRELYEETRILVSAENLMHVGTYFVVHDNVSFKYTTFRCVFTVLPEVQINPSEHIRYSWLIPEGALNLELIPDADSCLQKASPHLNFGSYQLPLLPGSIDLGPPPPSVIEGPIKEALSQANVSAPQLSAKRWYASFGPPGAGKTTSLKAIEQVLPHLHVTETRVILNPASRLNFYLRKAFEEDDPRFFFPFQLEVLPTRFWLSMNAPDHALVDGSIFTALAYSRALYELRLLSPYEYGTFFANYIGYLHYLIPPQCVFYFYCDATALEKRIRGRKRRTERFYSLEYLEALWFGFSETALEISKSIPVRRIDTSLIDTRNLTRQEVTALYGLR